MSISKKDFHRIIDLLPEDRYKKLVRAFPKVVFEDEDGADELSPEELAEILREAKIAKEEVARGEYATFEEVFGDLNDDV